MAVESSFTSGGTTVVRFVLVPSSIAGKMAWILPLTSSYLEIAIQISHTITFKEFVSSSILFVFDFVLFYDMSGLSVEANFHKPYRNLSLFSYLELLWTGTVIKYKKMSYNFFLFLSVVNFINRNLTFCLHLEYVLSSFFLHPHPQTQKLVWKLCSCALMELHTPQNMWIHWKFWSYSASVCHAAFAFQLVQI